MTEINQGYFGGESQSENLHVRELESLISPKEVKNIHVASSASIQTVRGSREVIQNAVTYPSIENKLVVVSGPCSIHDVESALEYAEWLRGKREKYAEELEITMRVYFEKPRTTTGWEGFINDPNLDETFDINKGLLLARFLLCQITDMGVPAGTEILDPMTPQYFGGLISWGAFGARTTESQPHRNLASGLSFPVAFKNGTSGDTQVAVDAVVAAAHPHHFLAINDEGEVAIATTIGNPYGHVVLRGGKNGPNYNETSVANTVTQLEKSGRSPVAMVDGSHANSGKDFANEIVVIRNAAGQVARGSTAIMGGMIESHLKEGSQSFRPGQQHDRRISITDGCAGLDATEEMFDIMADSVRRRRG